MNSAEMNKAYPNKGKRIKRKSLGGEALLQKDYGNPLDCTLTSLAFLFGKNNYDVIEKYAMKTGYNGIVNGTRPTAIKYIMTQTMKELKIRGRTKSAYGKNVGYNWKKVVSLIDKNKYVVLSLFDDGMNHYHNHTVTIIGYEEFENEKFFIVYDNWSTIPQFIDYKKLCVISSINWYE